jgi:hypothetical protein
MNIESMIRAVAQIDLDETGHWDYHGHSSGLSFVRRMREQLGDLMGPEEQGAPFVKSPTLHHVLDSPKSGMDSPFADGMRSQPALPPQQLARRICGYAVNDAAALLRTVHQPTFWASFERIFSVPQELYTNEDHVFLPLLYSAMALGSLFGKTDDREGYETSHAQGLAYFRTARHLMDIADCRDLAHIQAVVLMILFLQSTAKLSQCYAYVGIALRSACRMGLHRSAVGKFDPVESETRKRLFWTIRNLDSYVGALIGLPNTLRDEDIDQDYPLEVDDEYITRKGILPMPDGLVSTMTAFNMHTRVVDILNKIVRKIYPIKFQTPLGMGDKSYSVPFASIREIENDLENWKNSLPPILTPNETLGKYTRIQQLLRLTYAYAQVMLYRPFLHFVANDKRKELKDKRAYACAASFINVSRNIIHIQTHMQQKGLLNGGYWFSMYTAFFSILALVYYAAENPDSDTTHALMRDALQGKEVLSALAAHSMAADRCSATLDTIFQRLPTWMREGRPNPAPNRKRTFEEGTVQPHNKSTQSPLAHIQSFADTQDPPQFTRRAATFPQMGPPNPQNMITSYPETWAQLSPAYTPGQSSTDGSYDSSLQTGVVQPPMPNSIDGTMPHYANQHSLKPPELTDLSNMVFPTANEPFLYPNQSLASFENRQQFEQGIPYAANGRKTAYSNIDVDSRPTSNPRSEGDIEAQFFALPPYIQQQHPQSHLVPQQAQQSPSIPFPPSQPMSYSQATPPLGNQTMPMSAEEWQAAQGLRQEIQNMFGSSEWDPMAGAYHNTL